MMPQQGTMKREYVVFGEVFLTATMVKAPFIGGVKGTFDCLQLVQDEQQQDSGNRHHCDRGHQHSVERTPLGLEIVFGQSQTEVER
jgi:hypothetical protein